MIHLGKLLGRSRAEVRAALGEPHRLDGVAVAVTYFDDAAAEIAVIAGRDVALADEVERMGGGGVRVDRSNGSVLLTASRMAAALISPASRSRFAAAIASRFAAHGVAVTMRAAGPDLVVLELVADVLAPGELELLREAAGTDLRAAGFLRLVCRHVDGRQLGAVAL